MNVILYIRVSDPSQIGNISFDAQIASCKKYAQENGWKIVKIFKEEGESAKTTKRTQLKELIEYCRINKGKVNVCLVYKIDRLARNQMDHFAIKARLLEYDISLRSATEPIDDTGMGKVIEGLFAAVAQLDNDIKSTRVTEAMQGWVLKGRWVWGAKFGYINKKDETDHAIMALDPIKGPIVTELFKKFSTGHYTYKNLADELNRRGIKSKKGMKIHPQLIHKILRDKFYMGVISKYGVETKGIHTPLTDEHTFYKCHEVILRKSNIGKMKRNTENEDFPMRRFIQCKECGVPMTAAWCKGRTKKYPKYYCVRKGCELRGKTYKRNDLHEDFYNLLGHVKPNEDTIELFKEMFIRVYRNRIQELEGDTIRLKSEIQRLQAEKARIIQMSKKQILTDEESNEELSQIRDQIAIAELGLHETKTDEGEIKVCLAYAQNFIQTVNLIWFDAPPLFKIKLQTMIFPRGVKYQFEKVSNHDLALPFKLNREFEDSLSRNVTPTGVEPVLPG